MSPFAPSPRQLPFSPPSAPVSAFQDGFGPFSFCQAGGRTTEENTHIVAELRLASGVACFPDEPFVLDLRFVPSLATLLRGFSEAKKSSVSFS